MIKLDNIYVVDKDSNRIQKFDTNGKFIQMWDKFITSNGTEVKMYLPEAMAVNPLSGDVYITDTGNNRTLIWTANLTNFRVGLLTVQVKDNLIIPTE